MNAIPLIILCVTCALIILSVLFFPAVKLGRFSLSLYWVIALLGAAVALAFGGVSFGEAWAGLTASSAMNPVKILVLFISMTLISVFLDEAGLFKYLAYKTLSVAGKSQYKLFFALYGAVSVLTVFTSNDIIILSFTPFICYFARNAKISPVPYLFAEFTAANSWSMLFIIGNPTNIYLASSFGVTFVEYFKVMALPTLAAGMTSLAILFLIFRKKLGEEICPAAGEVKITDIPSLIIGAVHLAACTVLLVAGSYMGVDMWIAAAASAVSLAICYLVSSAIRKKSPALIPRAAKRAPIQLIPFVISMFILVLSIEKGGYSRIFGEWLSSFPAEFSYGISSFLASNLLNNIPMSILYSSVISFGGGLPAVYAAVIGSNLGAILTPIGALAGIMWSGILHSNAVEFSFKNFVKYGAVVSIPSLLAALGVLFAVI